MLNWEKFIREDGSINLVQAARESIQDIEKLPREDIEMLISILTDIEGLSPVYTEEAAAISLVLAKQQLLLAQILGELMGKLGVILKDPRQIQEENNRSAIKIVSSNHMPKGTKPN